MSGLDSRDIFPPCHGRRPLAMHQLLETLEMAGTEESLRSALPADEGVLIFFFFAPRIDGEKN